MNLTVHRRPSTANSTIGELSSDSEGFLCYTLEDVVRELPGEPVAHWKVPGATAIPAGRYRVTVTYSPHFGRDLPLLNMVPGFAGVRIHPGNTAADTEGCILVGTQIVQDAIVESRKAFAGVFQRIDAALADGDEVWIELLNAQKA